MRKGVIFRADDAGSCVSANEAMLEAIEGGVLRNVSVMSPPSGFGHAAKTLAPWHKKVDFGVHFTLTAEWRNVRWGPLLPVDRVPSLVDPDGTLPRRVQHHEGRLNVEQALAEAAAQIAAIREAGFEPTYLDDHMCVSESSGLREPLEELCRKEGLINAMFRNADYPEIEGQGSILQRALQNRDGFVVYVTHPAKDAPDVRAFGHEGYEADAVIAERDGDRRDLTDPKLVAAVREGRVASLRYSEALTG